MLAFRILAVYLGVSLVAACVSPQVLPDPRAVSRLKGIHIVPMETHPLTIDSSYIVTESASDFDFQGQYITDRARAVGVLSGIAVLIELSELSRGPVEYTQSFKKKIEPIESWFPSVEIAQEARNLLAASGRSPTISSEIKPIPGIQNRGRTVLMENWMAPIRAWYNDRLPCTQYAALTVKGIEAVVEIGISNYEICAGKLLLQVHIKLIDAASGQLLGRSRASSFTDLPPMRESFQGDAKLFKESVSQAGKQLLVRCLRELGMLPK